MNRRHSHATNPWAMLALALVWAFSSWSCGGDPDPVAPELPNCLSAHCPPLLDITISPTTFSVGQMVTLHAYFVPNSTDRTELVTSAVTLIYANPIVGYAEYDRFGAPVDYSRLIGLSAGTTTVTARYMTSGGVEYTDTETLTVTPSAQLDTAGVSALSIDGQPPVVGGSSQLVATATFVDGTTRDVTADSTWFSSDPSVMTIAANGVALGIRGGSAIAQATYQGRLATRAMNIVIDISRPPTGSALLLACAKDRDDASNLTRTLYVEHYPGTSLSQVDLGFTAKDGTGSFSVRLDVVNGAGTSLGTNTQPLTVTATRARAPVSFVFSPPLAIPRDSAVWLVASKVSGPELFWEGSATNSCSVLVKDGISTAELVAPRIPVQLFGAP